MTIDTAKANSAPTSANIAQATGISATDGAQIQTDEERGGVADFAAIFEQLSQGIVSQETPQQPEATEAPKLPKVLNLPPAPPASNHIDHPALLSNLQVIDDPAADAEVENTDPEQKPSKPAAIKSDAVNLAVAVPPQPLEISNSTPPPNEPEPQPVIPASTPQRKPLSVDKMTLPKVKEADEAIANTIKPRDPHGESESPEIPQELPQDIPVSSKDDPAPTQQKKIDPPKLEFTLPQPHITQKELEPPAAPPAPEQSFIQSNHPQIISTIRGHLIPNGGSMHIRLDPPELGALNVQIDVRDGIVNASFQTSNDEATRLLSHSLTQLRTTLESAGVSVEKLQVQQAPREHFNSNSRDSDRSPNQQAYERSAHDDRQRREMLQRMWRRLTVGRDMLDLVA